MKKRGLGDRGLNALLAGSKSRTEEESKTQDKVLKELPLDLIERGQYQPRRENGP